MIIASLDYFCLIQTLFPIKYELKYDFYFM